MRKKTLRTPREVHTLRKRGRRLGFAAGGLGLLVVVGGWLGRGGPEPPPTPRAEAPSAHPAVAAPGPGSDVSVGRIPPFDVLAADAAVHYRERARFPPASYPLGPDAADPLLTDSVAPERRDAGSGNGSLVLTARASRMNYGAPEPIVVHASLTDGGRPVQPESMAGTLVDSRGESGGALAFRDDGRGSDAAAGDGNHVLELPSDALAEGIGGEEGLAASFQIDVVAMTRDGEELRVSVPFWYSDAGVSLTGQFRDSLVGGSLLIQVEIDARGPGRYHVAASLYSGSGERKLMWAENALDVDRPGRHWIPLEFYGLGLSEAGIDGPYRLKHVQLTDASSMPNALLPLATDAYVTGDYSTGDFTNQPFDNPEMLAIADRLDPQGAPSPPPR